MRLLYITGTRSDWSKLDPLIVAAWPKHDVHCAVTGQHLDERFGYTAIEVERRFRAMPWRCWRMPNEVGDRPLTEVLSATADFLRRVAGTVRPDMVVVHGDRTEALAGAMLALSGYRVAHVEGGEVSGCIDDRIRDAITALATDHYVCNERAAERVREIAGEGATVHVIGSPELDMLLSDDLPTLDEVRARYNTPPPPYGICIWHPDTCVSPAELQRQTRAVVTAMARTTDLPWVQFEPNSDPGHEIVRDEMGIGGHNTGALPSMRASHFATLLRNAELIIGNSSVGVREAPSVGVPSVDIGGRQRGRANATTIVHSEATVGDIADAIQTAREIDPVVTLSFGDGRAGERFAATLDDGTEVAA